jgi:uncharacterized BrkB/YihY/UPF0761 family membrane protein
MSFKLSLKQLFLLLLITLLLALALSMLATWVDWRANPNELFYSESAIHWLVVWETLSSWLWPLWIMFTALGYVFMMIYRIVND